MLTLTKTNTRGGHVAYDLDHLSRLPCNVTYKPKGDRYFPIAHSVLAERVRHHVLDAGYEIESETYLVSSDGSRIHGGFRIAAPDSIVAKAMEKRENSSYLASDEILLPGDINYGVGFRHGLDGQVAFNGWGEADVEVCKNGMRSSLTTAHSGEMTKRMHTTPGVGAYDDAILATVRNLAADFVSIGDTKRTLSDRDLSDNEGDSIIIEAGRTEVIPWGRCRDVAEQWHTPNHPEFAPRNAWSLYNAFTEAVKLRTPAGQGETLDKLGKFFLVGQN